MLPMAGDGARLKNAASCIQESSSQNLSAAKDPSGCPGSSVLDDLRQKDPQFRRAMRSFEKMRTIAQHKEAVARSNLNLKQQTGRWGNTGKPGHLNNTGALLTN